MKQKDETKKDKKSKRNIHGIIFVRKDKTYQYEGLIHVVKCNNLSGTSNEDIDGNVQGLLKDITSFGSD